MKTPWIALFTIVTGSYSDFVRINLPIPGTVQTCDEALKPENHEWMHPYAEQSAVNQCGGPVKRVSDWDAVCEFKRPIYIEYGVSAQFECVAD